VPAQRYDELETKRNHGADTGGDNHADIRLVRILPYSCDKDVSGTNKRMAETADTANVLETLEATMDTM
jgi:hypothetical protein